MLGVEKKNRIPKDSTLLEFVIVLPFGRWEVYLTDEEEDRIFFARSQERVFRETVRPHAPSMPELLEEIDIQATNFLVDRACKKETGDIDLEGFLSFREELKPLLSSLLNLEIASIDLESAIGTEDVEIKLKVIKQLVSRELEMRVRVAQYLSDYPLELEEKEAK